MDTIFSANVNKNLHESVPFYLTLRGTNTKSIQDYLLSKRMAFRECELFSDAQIYRKGMLVDASALRFIQISFVAL